MRQIFHLCFLFLLLIVTGCQTAAQSTNATAGKLFNGKNLDGWYTFLQNRGRDNDPKKVFTVQNGMIRVSGEEWGCITTNDEYANYKLVVEFKWGTKTFAPRVNNAMDNGILLHSTGADGAFDGTWMHSIECQIIEGGTGDLLVVGDETPQFALTSAVAKEKQNGTYIFQPGGSPVTINGGRINWFDRAAEWQDVKGFRGKGDIEKPVGEWNRIECIAKGDSIDIMLNGVLVNQAHDVKPAKGKIQIQSEGAEIFFRRVELTPL
ncbi:MAG: DUF1080 domain-containing protein [Chitinophagaceae bacterium]|nr:MAG: DUF1080 domain-containing protein [Chitinophagaceae bacterium]